MLSETPTNDAVDFVTGAGGFLQQVIFGYTGLRLGERGLEPAFPPVLPSQHHPTRAAERPGPAAGATTCVVDSAGPADRAARGAPADEHRARAQSLRWRS